MYRKAFSAALALALLPGCMSDREYQLRARQLANQANHPATYDLFTVEGPIKIELADGGKAKVTVPGQPFREITIPDGVQTQADLVQHLLNIGAISVLGWKALDNTNSKNVTTTINGGTP